MDQQTVTQSSGNHWSWIEERKRILKIEDSLRDFLNNIKCIKIHMIGAPE